MMHISLCDDETSQTEILEKYITEWSEQRGIPVSFSCFESSEAFLFDLEDHGNCDLLVLDIEMKGISGIELARKLRSDNINIPILFVTGYDSYMSQGFDVAALHYLIKPVNKDKLFEVLDRADRGIAESPRCIFSAEDGSEISVPVSDIWYIEATGHSCVLYKKDTRVPLRISISTASGTLKTVAADKLVSCHRSYIVNLDHVSQVTRSDVVLDDGRCVPLSRLKAPEFQKKFISNYA
jgi:DNA-binding LytR/AlgR family response regulator